MIQDMIDAVRICRMTGCDGVDINAYGGYLLDEFLTDAFNHRTDEFGGSMDGKLKVLLDVIKAVKRKIAVFQLPAGLAKHHAKGIGQGNDGGRSISGIWT